MKKAVCLSACLFAGSVSAAPISFNFLQSGFEEGAVVTGVFSGEDLDSNGRLSSFDGEITDFTMAFSGNSLVSSFSLGFADLFGVVYDLDGGPLGDNGFEGIVVSSVTSAYLAAGVDLCDDFFGVPSLAPGCGIVAEPTGSGTGVSFTSSTSSEFVVVSPQAVPEPASLALLGLGLAGIGLARRKKSV